MADADRTAWVDYGRQQCGAEEAVAVAIDTILTDGGTLLWQKYLERKAFAFAANAVSDALIARLQMCYVHHDQGEPDLETDEGWQIEAEPEPADIDCWARMHLPVRRLAKNDPDTANSTSSKMLRTGGSLGRSGQRSRGRKTTKVLDKLSELLEMPRSMTLPEENALDVEEERMREAKAQEETRRKDREKRAKESEKAKEEERKQVQRLQEEMSKRPFSFDCDGNLMWVDEFRVDRLPKLQEAFGYNVKKERKVEDINTKIAGAPSAPASPTSPTSPDSKRKKKPSLFQGKKKAVQPEFTDGFSKLQYGQPPILDTMDVKAGVMLESMGKKKVGPDLDYGSRMMSRKEYVQLAEKEVAMDGERSHSFFASTSKEPDSPSPAHQTSIATSAQNPSINTPAPSGSAVKAGQGVGSDFSKASKEPSASAPSMGGADDGKGKGVTLPQIPQGRASATAGNAYPSQNGHGNRSAQPGAEGEKPVQKAPPAPPPFTRNRKFESLGFVRPPRYHVPQLGGPQGVGAAQPPLGATMGHGLLRSNSLKEAYFFPPAIADLPASLMKSSSEATLGSARRSSKIIGDIDPGRMMSPGDLDPSAFDKDDSAGGRLRTESTPAYRNFRHALLPPDAPNSFNKRF